MKGEDELDLLKSLFGNVTSSILRLAVIAGTLALIYVFAIRPTLDAATDAVKIIGDPLSGQSSEGYDTNRAIQELIEEQIRSANQQVKRQLNQSFQQTVQPGGANPQALLRCVRSANGNVRRLQACQRRF